MNANNNVEENKFSKYMVWAVIISIILSFVFYSLKLFFPQVKAFDFPYDVSVSVFGASFSVWLAELIIFRKVRNEREEIRERLLIGVKDGMFTLIGNLHFINEELLKEIKKDYEIEVNEDKILDKTLDLLQHIKNNCNENGEECEAKLDKYVRIIKTTGYANLIILVGLLNRQIVKFVNDNYNNSNFETLEIHKMRTITHTNPFTDVFGTDVENIVVINNLYLYIRNLNEIVNGIEELRWINNKTNI